MPSTHCDACNRAYKQIKPHLRTKKHAKNTLLLQQRQHVAPPQEIHECSICLDDISSSELHTTQCGHHFHKDCINNWRAMKNNCPNCRAIIPPLQRQPGIVAAERRQRAVAERRRQAVMAAERRQRAVAEARQREIGVVRVNYNLINVLIETIALFEQFDHIDPEVLNDARFRLMQLLN